MKKIFIPVLLLLAFGASVAFFLTKGNSVSQAEPAAGTQTAQEMASGSEMWALRCDDKKDKSTPMHGRCEIFQRLVVKETGKRFVEVAIGYPEGKDGARGIIVAPLGIVLQAGMLMKIDDGKPFAFQARFCNESGCYGYVDMNQELLDALSNGNKLTLTFQAGNGKNINVELSLKDFATALQKIS